MSTTWMPIYQQLFLLSHEPDGRPQRNHAALATGLAGAVLAELVLAESIRVDGDRFYVYSVAPAHPDPLAGATVAAMLRVEGGRQVSHWLRVMSGDIYERVSGGLLAAGLVRREARRRDVRYVHTDLGLDAQLLGNVRTCTYSRNVPPPPVLAMAGFFHLLRLEDHLHLNVPTTELRSKLKSLLGMADRGVQDVIGRTEQQMEAAAMAVYG